MTELPAMLIPAVALALLHFLWQGALIGLLAWPVLTLLRNTRPQARYAVACMILLVCALLPVIDVMLALRGSGIAWPPAATHTAVDYATASLKPSMANAGSFATSSTDAFAWIVAFWAAGAALLSLRMTLGVLWVRRLCAGSATDPDPHWQDRVDRLAQRFGIRRAIGLRIVATGDSPVSAGWWRPMVLLPVAVVARMPTELLEALLAHEIAHIHRHDYLVNLLQSAVEAILFYHPVVWWLSHRIRIERELVADDLAAEVLGERRRLAVALAELDRMHAVPMRAPCPHPQFAQAAHGGHLMSRIQQLLRPQRQRVGGALALPVLGLLLAASVAVYAHAHQQPQPLPMIDASSVPAATATSQPSPRLSPLPTPRPTTGPVTALSMPDMSASDDKIVRVDSTERSYALVHKNREAIRMSGSTDDIDDIRLARRAIDGDFVWLRRNGKAFVIRDAGVLARIENAWKPTQALDARMSELNARMLPHQKEMEALQARMERRQAAFEDPDMRDSREGMEMLSRKMESLGDRQQAMASRMSIGGAASRELLARQMQVLQSEQEDLARQMEQHAQDMEVASRQMERLHAPMEALGREMEVAAGPMQAIGKQMEALGSQIEREVGIADRSIRTEIDAAVQHGLAMPAPSRQ